MPLTSDLAYLGTTQDYREASRRLLALLSDLSDDDLRQNAVMCSRVAVRGIGTVASPEFQASALKLGERIQRCGGQNMLSLAVRQTKACLDVLEASFDTLSQALKDGMDDAETSTKSEVGNGIEMLFCSALELVVEEVGKTSAVDECNEVIRMDTESCLSVLEGASVLLSLLFSRLSVCSLCFLGYFYGCISCLMYCLGIC